VLEVVFKAEADLDKPIVGFYFKDRLGQELFGDNTYLAYAGRDFRVAAGQMARARFSFAMPRLAAGDYHFTVGLATGTQQEHVIQHWIHEALHIKAQGQGVPRGILGLPMHQITLEHTEL
jgi:lipopolysaccharide transport system ATP-binding protein